MSRMGRRFVFAMTFLTGAAALLIVFFLVGQVFLPGVFGPLPAWLPEDTLSGLPYRFFALLLDWIPALAFSALLLTFSYWLKPEEIPPRESSALVRLSLIAILSTVAFSVLTLFFSPWIDARLSNLDFRKAQAVQLEDEYLRIKGNGADRQSPGDLEARLSLLKRLGLLRPQQNQQGGQERMDYDFELQILKAHFELDEFFKLRALPGVVGSELETGTTVEDQLDRAEKALADGTDDREYQANLWAFQAYRRLTNASDQGHTLPGKLLDRAKAVIDESWARIYEKTLATDERLKASYFFRKGKSLGDFQFQNFLEAYYGFQELHKENPRDDEVARYGALALEKVKDQVLFIQDLQVLFAVPASQNQVFLNRSNPMEVVRIGKLLDTSQGVFVKDFEFLRFSPTGQVLLHWTAPYGRWGQDGIDFRVWEKDSPEPRFPVVLVESPGNEYDPLGNVDPPRFVPGISVQALEVVNSAELKPQTMGTWDLMVHGQAIEALGYNSRLFQTEFVARLASPFAFFLAFLFVLALAWRNRVQEAGRHWWFLVPSLPLVSEFLVHSAVWAARLGIGGLLTAAGLTVGALILGVGILVLSVVGVVLVQRTFHRSFG